MRKLITLSLLFSLGSPALADFSSLTAERDQLFNKVMAGTADQNDIDRFRQLTDQIKQSFSQQFDNTTTQFNSINQELERQQQQNDALRASLFGGPTSKQKYKAPSPVATPLKAETPRPDSGVIPGGISTINYQVDKLVNKALENNVEAQAAKTAVDFYSKNLQKTLATGKDSFNYMIPYRGFAPSEEGGKLILAQEIKTKTLAAAMYKQQRIIDETHLKLMTAIMQLATDIGKPTGAATSKGYEAVKALVGEEEAQSISQNLLESGVLPPENKTYDDPTTFAAKHLKLVTAAVDKDPTVKEIIDSVHKYMRNTKASRIIMPTLAGLSMVPLYIAPVARGALMAYVYSRGGGSNEDKLLKELYLDKRLESRVNLIDNEAYLALRSYEMAVQTDNPVLLSAAVSLMESMSSPEIAGQLTQ